MRWNSDFPYLQVSKYPFVILILIIYFHGSIQDVPVPEEAINYQLLYLIRRKITRVWNGSVL